MPRFVIALALLCSSACSSDAGPQLPAAGEACDEESQCAAGLDCMHLVCADDRGPNMSLSLPEHLTVLDGEVTMLTVSAIVDSGIEGDQVEFVVDPAAADPHREVVALEDAQSGLQLLLAAPLAVGPHHVRARVLDGDGQPYANPSATVEIVLFVRDPEISDTPQVAFVWPPSGYEHRIGNPLEVQIAVLPGSFSLVADGPACQPLADCEPELAAECEDQCGPVERMGHPKIYTLPDYPGCLLDEPVNCNGLYIDALRPVNGVEVIDEHQVRTAIRREYLADEPGSVLLSVALSYNDHDPYPSEANVIHESITLKLIE